MSQASLFVGDNTKKGGDYKWVLTWVKLVMPGLYNEPGSLFVGDNTNKGNTPTKAERETAQALMPGLV